MRQGEEGWGFGTGELIAAADGEMAIEFIDDVACGIQTLAMQATGVVAFFQPEIILALVQDLKEYIKES